MWTPPSGVISAPIGRRRYCGAVSMLLEPLRMASPCPPRLHDTVTRRPEAPVEHKTSHRRALDVRRFALDEGTCDHSSSNVQRPTSNVQRPTSNVQRPTSSRGGD